MALNEVQYPGDRIQVTKSGVAAGDPVVVGALTGVTDTGSYTDANGVVNQVIVDVSGKVWNLPVGGSNAGGAVAVALYDQLYITDGDTPKISKKATGQPFGIALGTVSSGGTGTIPVKHNTL